MLRPYRGAGKRASISARARFQRRGFGRLGPAAGAFSRLDRIRELPGEVADLGAYFAFDVRARGLGPRQRGLGGLDIHAGVDQGFQGNGRGGGGGGAGGPGGGGPGPAAALGGAAGESPPLLLLVRRVAPLGAPSRDD